ncbi:hypothetical protein GGH15_001573 [Coemansia sp. RSA 562]|nr:hypothetical protein GGH15_001573 [Coemansia sp. RSA 562]
MTRLKQGMLSVLALKNSNGVLVVMTQTMVKEQAVLPGRHSSSSADEYCLFKEAIAESDYKLRIFARSSVRSVISAPVAQVQMRSYTDKFQERENASENMYIHEKEKEQLKLMREKLAKAQKQIDELEEHINNKERESTK